MNRLNMNTKFFHFQKVFLDNGINNFVNIYEIIGNLELVLKFLSCQKGLEDLNSQV